MESPVDDLEATRVRLRAAAADCARTLRNRPNVAGLILYGSLARGGLTRFSDVDIAVVSDGPLPEFAVEHRLITEVKLDLLHVRLNAVQDLTVHVPESLSKAHGVPSSSLESLLVGAPDTILFDPTQEIARVKRELGRLTSYRQLALPWARQHYHELLSRELPAAEKSWQAGDLSGTMEQARSIAQSLCVTLWILTGVKDVHQSAEAYGIPEFYAVVLDLKQLCAPPAALVQALWQALSAVWEYSRDRAYRPILQRLAGTGLTRPESLELMGRYGFYWTGLRLTELGRVIADVDLSLEWSRDHLNRAEVTDALWILRKCRDADAIVHLWRAVETALADAGCDVSEITQALFSDPEFGHRLRDMDRCVHEARFAARSTSEAGRALSAIRRLLELLDRDRRMQRA